MHHGTPEARLWAAVVLTLINDCRDELATAMGVDSIAMAADRWRSRAMEPSFMNILDIVEIDPRKVCAWVTKFERRSKKALLLGRWDLDDALWANDREVIGRGQKRAY